MKRLLFIAIISSLLMPSCAYMQTHKIVGEIGVHYVGAEIKTDSITLYDRAGEWYIAAPKVLLKRHYPIIYDTIYLDRDNAPTESVMETDSGGALLYMPISAGTATVLQRTDGYVELVPLIRESNGTGRHAVDKLPGGKRHDIRAHIETRGQGSAYYVLKRNPEKSGFLVRCLSTLDKYTIDVAGTVAYNVSIPFMAPFRFFSEFITED